MKRSQACRRKPAVALLLWAILCVAFGDIRLTYAQGEDSQLTPVFPSWDRVIEELRAATQQQKAGLVAAEQQLPASQTLVITDEDTDYADLESQDAADSEASASLMGGAKVEDGEQEDALVDDAASISIHSTAADGPSTASVMSAEGDAEAADTELAGEAAADQDKPVGQADAGRAGGPQQLQQQQQQQLQKLQQQQGAQEQQQQQQEPPQADKQQQKPRLPKGAFPAAYLPRPSADDTTGSSSSSSSSDTGSTSDASSSRDTGSSSDANSGSDTGSSIDAGNSSSGEVKVSLQGLGILNGADGSSPLPRFRAWGRGGQAAPKEGASSSSGSSSGSAGSAGSPASGPRVRLLPPNTIRAPGTGSSPQPQPQTQQQQQQAKSKHADAALPVPTAEEARNADKADQQLAGQKILPREPLHISPPPSISSVTSIELDHALLQIPSSFMGISHEWNHVADMNAAPGYKAALRLLSSYGTGPFIVRVGGGSTDNTKEVLGHNVYNALRQVYKETGVRYILGLNFEDVNLKLTQAQIKRARANLPEDSVVTFELGNEPNFYARKKNLTALEYSRCCFTTEWTDFARNLSCPCGTDQCCTENQFAGPVWGHINVYPSTFKWFLDNAASYVSLVTVHWYKATKETHTTPASLLDEGPIRVEMDNLKQLVQVANGFGKPLRVAEMNTISNSGRLGVSNVFAAALWTLDGAFEVAASGAVGVNLHQGAGQNLYTGAILRRVEGSTLKPVVLRPAFYGMLMFQQAVRGGAILLGKQQLSADSTNIKVWPLLDTTNGELRFVLINKHAKQAATQVLRLPADSSSSYQSIAHLSRLVAQGGDPLAATTGITLGGKWYAAGCSEQGRDQTLLLEADAGPTKQLAWSIYLPPGSATLVRIPPAAAKTVV